jgi:tetratricopeptide (TPR) repeat protein
VRRLTDAVSPSAGTYTPECLLSAAEAAAKEAVAEDPTGVDRHYALAVILGLRADREGGRSKVLAASAMYDQLRAILSMDPEHVGAHHLMGRLQAGVMRMDRVTRWIATHLLGGGILKEASWAAAEHNLAFAVAAAPEVPDYRYELARLYEDTGRAGLALKEAERVLATDPSAALEPTVHAKAAALVTRLQAAGAH